MTLIRDISYENTERPVAYLPGAAIALFDLNMLRV
jgi:hypothetical protein